MDESEKILLKKLKAGDDKAYKHLYDKHYTVLCHIAATLLKDDFLAAAIVDDVIFHLWEIRENVEIKSSLRMYLMSAVKRRCLNYMKQNRFLYEKRSAFDFGWADNISDPAHPLGILLEKEMEDTIMKVVDNLPAESRKVFKKSRFERKKYEEIASDLGISINTVKYHIKRAISIISEKLEKYL